MKIRLRFFLAVILMGGLTAVTSFGADAVAVKHVDAPGAEKLLKEDAKVVVLDIRTPKEFAEGHLQGAQNIDYYADDFEASLKKLETDKTYLVYCASGGRSTKSLQQFAKLGFKSIVHLDSGYKGWEKARLPVEK